MKRTGRTLIVIAGLAALLAAPGATSFAEARTPRLGTAVTTGTKIADFNCDKRSDVATGVQGESFGSVLFAGAVHVVYAASTGVNATSPRTNQLWSQNSAGVPETAEGGDDFGHAVSVGDFNADGCADLAVGAPKETINGNTWTGSVNVIYGSVNGLNATSPIASQLFRLGAGGLLGTPRAYQFFGDSMSAGDFNGDGYADLAIGIDGYNYSSTVTNVGAVEVLYGSGRGLTSSGVKLIQPGVSGNLVRPSPNMLFGFALASGDFNVDTFADLAIGIPHKALSATQLDAGQVNVIYGSAVGLAAVNQLWTQGVGGLLDSAQQKDGFGTALAAGDLNGDRAADLAVAVPNQAVSGKSGAGAVHVIYGAITLGLTSTGNQIVHQDASPGGSAIPDAAETGDGFGSALAIGDFDGNGIGDLGVGVPYEDIGTAPDAGAATVVPGSSAGLTGKGSLSLRQGGTIGSSTTVIKETPQKDDRFAFALAAWDFGNGGQADLAVGVPFEDLSTTKCNSTYSDCGGVQVIYGSSAGLTATANQWWTQDSPSMVDDAEAGDAMGSSLG